MRVIHESSKSKRTYKCPYCDLRGTKEKLIRHVDDKHDDMIPENYTPSRIIFNLINKKEKGSCIVCGNETLWNEDKCRYDRLCTNPKCKSIYRERVESNVKAVYGKTSKELLKDPNHQTKMLAGRRISGVYKWSDGECKTYTGEYERKTLEFCESMGFKSEDILTPGPSIEYMYNGEKHFWITDIFIAPYNLAIDCKDGGDNPNNRPMKEYREKQIEKEKAIAKDGRYNYLRLTDNNFKQLIEVLALLKLQLVEDNRDERIIKINEAMFATIGSFMPPEDTDNVYIVNYCKNSVFEGLGISKDLYMNDMIVRNEEGVLSRVDKSFLEDTQYSVYQYSGNIDKKNILDHIDSFVSEGFLYENIFKKKYYCREQLFSENIKETIDLPTYFDAVYNVTRASILSEDTFIKNCDGTYSDKNGDFIMNESSGIRTPSRDKRDGFSVVETKIISEGGL